VYTPDAVLLAVVLFSLRVFNYAISTLRLVSIARGQKPIAAVLAFVEALVFALTMAGVVADLSNLLNLAAFCFGASVGSYFGMWLESKFVRSFSTVQVITGVMGHELAEHLRDKGFGVTETRGTGRDGEVTIIRSTITSKEVPRIIQEIRHVLPNAFIEVETARTIQRGYIAGLTPRGQPNVH
jgi:uncharacterized protein YebE (UPF0316 family)